MNLGGRVAIGTWHSTIGFSLRRNAAIRRPSSIGGTETGGRGPPGRPDARRPPVHGKSYFAELRSRIDAMDQGDRLLFTNWRGDPDELLDGPGSEVSTVLCAAAKRGGGVKGLIWRSHLDRFRFSAEQNRTLAQDVEVDGGQVVLDMRVRVGG